ncbi:hypothetical protein DSCA_30310 [Desulfosarcina alkanivorans]|uniref:Uncharacterized protein n=1 Tax=Desulfosarcina alkanivorans TaxID=571177 RepID=A0A5K7YQ64_9BACT|nr:hypothetical protein [Desulfosarcina alkanivorans]BBO69101.1 hypothetical protein DSCA_30310 [Desulfosarcina alkanivorans]
MKHCNPFLTIATILLLSGISHAGWFSNSPTEVVKGSTLNLNETTTIGQAFDGAFDSPAWQDFTTDKGQAVVEFSGRISEATHQAAVKMLGEYYSAYDLYRFCMANGDYSDFKGDESDMGQLITHFMNTQWWPVGAACTVQFLMNVDGESFQVGAMESTAWRGIPETTILEIIYQ